MFDTLIELMNDTGNINHQYHALWDDAHISKGMLQSHLAPDEEGATSKHAFVKRSARWLATLAPPAAHPALLDLGCGPGIYAGHFAALGYTVTGIDYSKRSIAYAKQQAKANGSGITYLYQNYLSIGYTGQFDVVTLINKDYAVLSREERATLLQKIVATLKPGGKFIFDVFTPAMRQKEHRTWQAHKAGGFFSGEPHILLEEARQCGDPDQTEMSKYYVITAGAVKCFATPNHYFTKEKLLGELRPAGFQAVDLYGDIAGEAYPGSGNSICAVCTK